MMQGCSATSKVLVDQKGGNSLLYLPLDQLLKQSQTGAAAPAAGADATPARPPEASVTLDPGRPREMPRTRERGDSR